VRKADNLPTSCAVVTKSWNLNFLEPSGSVLPLQPSNVLSATPLTLRVFHTYGNNELPPVVSHALSEGKVQHVGSNSQTFGPATDIRHRFINNYINLQHTSF